MKHEMKLQSAPFELIRNGKKNIEVRLCDEKRRQLKIGDIIEFRKINNPDEAAIRVKVVELINRKTFKDLFEDFPAEDFGGNNSTDLLKNIYLYYTKKQESEYGVLGIKITLV